MGFINICHSIIYPIFTVSMFSLTFHISFVSKPSGHDFNQKNSFFPNAVLTTGGAPQSTLCLIFPKQSQPTSRGLCNVSSTPLAASQNTDPFFMDKENSSGILRTEVAIIPRESARDWVRPAAKEFPLGADSCSLSQLKHTFLDSKLSFVMILCMRCFLSYIGSAGF